MSDLGPDSSGSMREAARSGGRWSVIESFGSQAVATVMTLVLARLVAQEDFGIIAIVTVVTNALAIVTQFGLSASLIQRDDVTDRDRSTMFWISLAIGSVLAAVGIAFSRPLAATFGGVSAAPYLAVAVIGMPFNLTGAVFRAVLVRNLRFRPVALSSTLGTLGQATVAIGLAALFSAGAWAIILGKLFRAVFVALAWAVTSRWLPGRSLDWSRFREHFSFNAGWAAGSVATAAVKNVDYVIVSHLLGEAQVGVYYVAYVLPDLVRLRVLSVFRTALFPILSRIRSDRHRFTAAYLEVVQVVALAAFPVMIGLALVSEPLTDVAFGSTFAAAAIPMAIVAMAAAFDAVWQVVATALGADGTPGRAFWIVIARLAVLVGAMLWLVPDRGLVGAGYAVLLSSLVVAVLGQALAVRQFGIEAGAMISSLAPVALPTIAMVLAVRGVDLALGGIDLPSILLLVVLPLVGVVAYGGTLRLSHPDIFHRVRAEFVRFVVPSRSG